MLSSPLGKLTTMPAKMMSEMPLPMPRSEICSPSHMTKTVPVVRVSTVSSLKPQPGLSTIGAPAGRPDGLEEDGDAEGLDEADADRAVAGVLGDLLAAELALLRQALEVGPDDGQQLEDDRGRDVGHDAQGEDGHPGHVPAGEEVDEAEQGPLLRLPELLQGGRVEAGVRDLPADPVDREQEEGEDDPLPQLGDAEDVADAV